MENEQYTEWLDKTVYPRRKAWKEKMQRYHGMEGGPHLMMQGLAAITQGDDARLAEVERQLAALGK